MGNVAESEARKALAEAVRIAGGQSAFARLCGVAQPSVWKWLNRGKLLPGEHVLIVEAATGVSRSRLRLDLYPIVEPQRTSDSVVGARA